MFTCLSDDLSSFEESWCRRLGTMNLKESSVVRCTHIVVSTCCCFIAESIQTGLHAAGEASEGYFISYSCIAFSPFPNTKRSYPMLTVLRCLLGFYIPWLLLRVRDV